MVTDTGQTGRLPICICAPFIFLFAFSCREEEKRNNIEEVFTISSIQNFDDPSHPQTGSIVKLSGVIVTAVDSYDEDGKGHTGNIWVSDLDSTGMSVCGSWCGIVIYNPQLASDETGIKTGDVVDIIGVYDEFLYNDDGSPPDPANLLLWHTRHLSEISSGTVFKSGDWISPAAIEVESWQVQMEPRGGEVAYVVESLEGVLVLVRNLTVIGNYDSYGQFQTEEGVMIEDDLFHYPCAGYNGDITGTRFDWVRGVVTWFGIKDAFGNYKILPRGPEDFSPPPDQSLCN